MLKQQFQIFIGINVILVNLLFLEGKYKKWN